jgi:predicted metal-dependent peptidase
MTGQDVETKLTAARAALIMEKPFLGALVLRLPLIEADPNWCRSTATDARGFYYNRGYIDKLSFEQTKFMLAHEALHCALGHFARRQHRHKRRWDLACDFAVNPLLIADGLTAPPGALLSPRFSGMAAEEIYPYLQDSQEEQTLDQHLYDDANEPHKHRPQPPTHMPPPLGDGQSPPGAPPPAPLSAPERDQLQIQWQQRLAGAAQNALRAGKLGAHLMRVVDDLLQPQLPWRNLLAHYLTTAARDDYDFAHPSRREGTAILPGLRSDEIDVVVAIDTSGSIADPEVAEFVSEINALKGQLCARVRALACDERINDDSPWIAETWEPLELPNRIGGGGGTRFTPVFDWVSEQERTPDVLVYLTDAEGEFPAQAPSYPVLWLVKGKAQVPWGTRIQLN